jgi:glutamate--cysteine ligase
MMSSRVAGLIDDLRRDVFAPPRVGGGALRVGAEVELIPVDATSRRACPIVEPVGGVGGVGAVGETGAADAPATLPVVRRLAARERWTEHPSPYGAPVFVTPDGGVVSYEPGGQLEYSAPPCASLATLSARLRATVGALAAEARAGGIELLAVGLDPHNVIDVVPLQLSGARYAAMDAYLATRGRSGARMMRQTASFQVTLDAGEDPVGAWRVLSAAAPYVTALFANSSRYAGHASGYRSARAHTWRTLDPTRTGLPAADAADPAAAYGAFALAAPAIFHRDPEGSYHSFADLLDAGRVTEADWNLHLTTLFPEVRPRRIGDTPTFEVRSADAISAEWYAAPLVLLAGIIYDRRARREAAELLGPADPSLLARAARAGLRDASIGPVAAELFALATRGATRLGDAAISIAELEVASEFAARYTQRGRSPADDADAAAGVAAGTLASPLATRTAGPVHAAALG